MAWKADDEARRIADGLLRLAAREALENYKQALEAFRAVDREMNSLEERRGILLRRLTPWMPEAEINAIVDELNQLNLRSSELAMPWEKASDALLSARDTASQVVGEVEGRELLGSAVGSLH